MINAHADPTLITADVMDTVWNGLSEFFVLEVVATQLFRLPLWLPFSSSVLEVPD